MDVGLLSQKRAVHPPRIAVALHDTMHSTRSTCKVNQHKNENRSRRGTRGELRWLSVFRREEPGWHAPCARDRMSRRRRMAANHSQAAQEDRRSAAPGTRSPRALRGTRSQAPRTTSRFPGRSSGPHCIPSECRGDRRWPVRDIPCPPPGIRWERPGSSSDEEDIPWGSPDRTSTGQDIACLSPGNRSKSPGTLWECPGTRWRPPGKPSRS